MYNTYVDTPPAYVAQEDGTLPYKAVDELLEENEWQSPGEQEHLESWIEAAMRNTYGEASKHRLTILGNRLLSGIHTEAESSRRRHWTILFTVCLATLQLICIAVLRKYDVCGPATGTWAHFKRENCKSFAGSLPGFMDGTERPLTVSFLFAGLAWLGSAMLQHRLQRRSVLQKPCAAIGLLIGSFFSIPFSVIEGDFLFIFALVPFCTTLFMFFGALAHWYFGDKVEQRPGPEYAQVQDV